MSSKNINSVFYAESYHPIQAGSIDGTDILPHDNAVYRALRCFTSGLYDPFRDTKIIGDPYCTLFVGRLNHSTTEDTLRQSMSKYGRVKNLRLVRHIVTGASRGYAFVEFETEREMRRAYKDAHHTFIDDSEILVDYNRQQLMPGWIPRRLGGGLGGKKESGQLRFGGRERPFRAPLRQIPVDELKRLGIPLPPEGRYMSRFQVLSPPRRKNVRMDDEKDDSRSYVYSHDCSSSPEPSSSLHRLPENVKDHFGEADRSSRHSHWHRRRPYRHEYTLDDKSSSHSKRENSDKHHKSSRKSNRPSRMSVTHDYSSDDSSPEKEKDQSKKRHKASRHGHQ